MYFLYTNDLSTFINDYSEAWNLDHLNDMVIIMFMDNGHRLAVPCSSKADDKELMQRLHIFYDLIRTGGGIFEFFGTKSSQRIDIVKVSFWFWDVVAPSADIMLSSQLEQTYSVGKRVGPPLNLGRHGPYNRQIHYFKDPSELRGTEIRMHLMDNTIGVLTEPDQQTHALNIVRTWDPYVATIMILLPVALSLSVSVIWSVVASVRYKADVQASTQTGFTIGGYVVTAGTFPNIRMSSAKVA
jgi:hypothetical protein